MWHVCWPQFCQFTCKSILKERAILVRRRQECVFGSRLWLSTVEISSLLEIVSYSTWLSLVRIDLMIYLQPLLVNTDKYYLTPPFCWKYIAELLWWHFFFEPASLPPSTLWNLSTLKTPQISLQWNWCLAPLKHMINYLWKAVRYSQVLNTQNGSSVQYIFGGT